MDELIQTFIDNYFTVELGTQLYKALGLFTVYGLTSIHQELPDIIMQEQDEHREVIVDQVVTHIQEGLNKLFEAQRITISDDASLNFKTTFLEATYAFGYREDYSGYQRVLENWTLSNEEKLATVVADILGEDVGNILEQIEWVYDGTVGNMTQLVNEKTQEERQAEDMSLLRIIRRNLHAYQAAFGTPASVVSLVDINMVMGSPFQVYLNLFRDSIINPGDLESTTFNLIWLALISQDGTENPQKLLLTLLDTLFIDLQQQQQFTDMLQKAMGRYQEFKDHQK